MSKLSKDWKYEYDCCILCGRQLVICSEVAECSKCEYKTSRRRHNDRVAKNMGFRDINAYIKFISSLSKGI